MAWAKLPNGATFDTDKVRGAQFRAKGDPSPRRFGDDAKFLPMEDDELTFEMNGQQFSLTAERAREVLKILEDANVRIFRGTKTQGI